MFHATHVFTFFAMIFVTQRLSQWGKKIRMDEICKVEQFRKVEQFLKRRQERSVAPPQTSGRLTAGDNAIEVHNQKSDSLRVSIPRHSPESLSHVPCRRP